MDPKNQHSAESSDDLPQPKGAFLLLLLSILLLFLVRPFLIGFIGIRLVIDAIFTFILISGTYSLSSNKGIFAGALLLAVPWIGTRWYLYFEPHPGIETVNLGLLAAFCAYASVIILIYLLKAKKVTTDMILGAICTYFLIGLMWGTLYALIESFLPGSFTTGGGPSPDRFDLIYYSFVTLTTLGFGDISPISVPARSLTTVEAVMGQIYLAVLVARLVGLHIGNTLNASSK